MTKHIKLVVRYTAFCISAAAKEKAGVLRTENCRKIYLGAEKIPVHLKTGERFYGNLPGDRLYWILYEMKAYG